uniref:Uncharacterized protein n=1 Tax=Timema shepardi TaxID=629360 RepID=A0A7R9G610_TIMSH|nr:unnamed protein product [Timema shepardi]
MTSLVLTDSSQLTAKSFLTELFSLRGWGWGQLVACHLAMDRKEDRVEEGRLTINQIISPWGGLVATSRLGHRQGYVRTPDPQTYGSFSAHLEPDERKALKEEDKDIGQPGPSATKRPRRF